MAQAPSQRVIHLIASNGLYGAERVILNLLGCSAANTVVACLARRAETVETFRQQAIARGAVFHLLPFSLGSALGSLVSLLGEQEAILHAHGNKEVLLAMLCLYQRRWRGRKTGMWVTQHGFTARRWKSRLYNLLNLSVCRWGPVSHVIGVSRTIQEVYLRFGVAPARLRVITNGVPRIERTDRQQARDRIANTHGVDPGMPWLAFAGRLSAEKNPLLALEVLRVLLDRGTPCILLIAGEGPLEEALASHIAQAGLQANVRMVGFVEDVPGFLSGIDVLVLPSLTEGTPMIVLEAMSVGIPIVAADVGGLPDILTDGVDGFLIRGHDPADFAHCVSALLNNPSIVSQIQKAASDTIRKRYSVEAQAAAYLQLYQELP